MRTTMMGRSNEKRDRRYVGEVVTLRGVSAKGKNRVREHGEKWLVREIDQSILSPSLGMLVCPAAYVGTAHLSPEYDRPNVIAQADGYCRWVKPVNDPHFEVV